MRAVEFFGVIKFFYKCYPTSQLSSIFFSHTLFVVKSPCSNLCIDRQKGDATASLNNLLSGLLSASFCFPILLILANHVGTRISNFTSMH